MPPRKKKTVPSPFPEMGRNLKAVREELGLTQAQLSHAMGASMSSVQRWESGEMPSKSWWPHLEEALGIERTDVIEGVPQEGRRRLADEVAGLRDEIAELKSMIQELL